MSLELRTAPQNRTRENIRFLSSTNPEDLYRVLDPALKIGLYPSQTIDFVRHLDLEFAGNLLDRNRYSRKNNTEENYFKSKYFALYFFSRDFIGPLRSLFSLSVLQEAGNRGFVHYLARDGYTEYMCAQLLHKHLDHKPVYNYVPLSVKLLRKAFETPDDLEKTREYLDQFGLTGPGDHYLVDIGFKGECPDKISRICSGPYSHFFPRLLVSETDDETKLKRPVMTKATGFLYDGADPNSNIIPWSLLLTDTSIKRAFEDVYGGFKTSSHTIVPKNDELQTDSKFYDRIQKREDVIKKQVALRGIMDQVKIMTLALEQGSTIEDFMSLKSIYLSNLLYACNFTFTPEILKVMFASHEPTNTI